MAAEPAIAPPPKPARQVPPGLWAAAVVALALVASYAPNVADLVRSWWNEPNYSHGFLVVPISLAIFWQRRDTLPSAARPGLLGWAGLAGLLAARSYLFEENQMWLETATIPAAAGLLVLAFGGWRLLWWALPGVLFLGLMMPLPPSINIIMSGPLQGLATATSAAILSASGLPVVTAGNVIYLGEQQLEVARACNGLSILMSFVTLVTATVIFARDFPIWQRATLLVSTVPIALIANVLRIVATAWAYHLFGTAFGNKVAHDAAGWLMMPLALALIWGELKILSWLVVEEQVDRRPMVWVPLQPAGPGAVKK